jgi:hypothetical protein
VSCPSATFCEAAGVYFNRSGTEGTLAEVWNGTKWAVQPTPNPSGATLFTSLGVSCPSATFCEAVGSYESGSAVEATLAEVWNGTKWAIQSTPNPTGASSSSLGGVSCPSATFCEAVGSYESGSAVEATLAEVWNGTTWAVQSTPNHTGPTSSSLGGVSCPSATSCEAVGIFNNGFGTLAEVWNGTTWAVQFTPNPTAAIRSSLAGVSCPSATPCEAVGSFTDSGDQYVTLVEEYS